MVRRNVFGWTLAILALLGARPAAAGPLLGTGNVEQDFNPTTNPNVFVLPVSSTPSQVAQTPWMATNGWVSGWNIKDIRTNYDRANDTLYVGVNFFGIAGDAYGSGSPGSQDTNHGGIDLAHLGGRKSITLAFAPDSPNNPAAPGAPAIVAGVPTDKSKAGPGIDGFQVAKYQVPQTAGTNDPGINHDYGQILADHMGNLAFDPSKDHPGFEFSITHFSTIPGLDPTKGLWISAYAGSLDDLVGESAVPFTRIPNPSAQQIPEPATVLTWSLVVAGAGWHLRRRGRSSIA
jgi:hypothetical protein